MIDDEAAARRWMVAVLAVLLAFVLHLVVRPAAGTASHLPFFVAIVIVSVIGGRGPATLLLAAGLAVTIWRLLDGSTSLPDSWPTRAAILFGYVVLGVLIILIGDSARRHAQDSKRARAELDMALSAAEVGSWNFDFAKRTFRYSSNVGPLIGRPAGFVHQSLEEWRRDVHPEDAPAVMASLREARHGEGYEVRYRYRTPEGEWRWMLSRGRVTRDATGHRQRADGIVMDVTGVRTAELDLRRSSQELRTLLDLVPAGVAIAHDTACDRITVSPRSARVLGIDADTNASYTGAQRDQLPYRCMRDGVEVRGEDLPMQVAARTGGEVHDFEFDLAFGDGRRVNLLTSAAPLFDSEGKVRGAIGVHTDITALKDAQRELERMDHQKNIFLATLAHELRNPLAPIRYAAAMLRTRADPSIVDEAGRIIERQTAQMAQLLDELLDMSRVTRDVIELRNEPVDLARVLRQEIEAVRPQLVALAHTVQIESTPHAWVSGDETRLHQVVGNLLSNAAKYTRPGGRLEVGLHGQDEHVVFYVRDNGIGIAAEDLPHVFDLFTQILKPGSSAGVGLGIGLAVVKRLVQLHGGTISVTSAGPGAGAEFVVQLPRASEPNRPAALPDAIVDRPTKETRVLVCDDNADVADTLAQLLQLQGYDVRVTHDGTEAKQAASEIQPDIAVLDLGLPDMSGEDVARWIRARPWGAGTLLVAITGWGQQHDRDRTMAAGFDHHLVKPVDPYELLRLLRRQGEAGEMGKRARREPSQTDA